MARLCLLLLWRESSGADMRFRSSSAASVSREQAARCIVSVSECSPVRRMTARQCALQRWVLRDIGYYGALFRCRLVVWPGASCEARIMICHQE